MSDFRSILEGLGYDLQEYGGFWRTKPIYRKSDNKTVLVINKTDGAYYDHKIKKGGSFKQLIDLSNGKLSERDLEELEHQQVKQQTRLRRNKEYSFPLSSINSLIKDYSYYTMRGISQQTLQEFKSGRAIKNDLNYRYVFPIIDSGKVVGFVGRSIDNKSKIKWLNIGDISKWRYPFFLNEKILLEKKTVILVESVGNVLRLWDCGIKNVLCCFGTNVCSGVFSTLIRCNMKKIIIAFDNDLPDLNGKRPGLEGARKAEKKLNNFFDKGVVKIQLPKEEGKDIFDMGKKCVISEYGQYFR